jgi:hypothetical protein
MDVQSMLSLVVVLLAAGYLGWRGVRILQAKSAGGCGSQCGGCPSSADRQPLVQIGVEKRP